MTRRSIATLFIALVAQTLSWGQKRDARLADMAVDYFCKVIKNGEAAVPQQFNKVRGDSLLMWQAWQKAVGLAMPVTLPTLTPLGEGATGQWCLPDSLEPQATLNFYYGSKGADGQTALPLFVYLHGSGPRALEWATGLKLCGSFDDAPSAYFIPQIPQEREWYRWYQQSKQWAIEALLRQSLAHGDIDPKRIYLFGISEGGYGSQRLASFYADYLAAAGPMAGGEPLKNAPAENCGNIGFSLLTGAKDYGFYRNILTGYTQTAFDSLQRIYPSEYRHKVELLEGYGHAINYAQMTPWLKTFERNPWPKHFVWEDYEMHGRHRQGFYNLGVVERPTNDPDVRTRYDVTIHGNVVDIKVQDVKYTCTQRDSIWGIEMAFSRQYSPSNNGRIRVFLNSQLADLAKPVTILVNGQKVYDQKPKSSAKAMAESLATFGDPLRIFPVAIELGVTGGMGT